MSDLLGFTPEQLDQVSRGVTEANTFRTTADREAYIDHLIQTPGLDPALAVADAHPEDIPEEGWLVKSHIAPGYGGVVTLERFPEGSFEAGSVEDTREKYNQARVYFRLKEHGSYTVAYENPAYPSKDTEPFDRMSGSTYTGLPFSATDIIPLSNGGRLLEQARPLTMSGSSSFFSLDWDDWSREIIRQHAPDMQVNRAVRARKDLGGVLVHLAAGMGLGSEDIQTFIEGTAQKLGEA